jgi:ribonuclease P protein component
MLPRSARLRRTAEIQQVLRAGRCLTTPHLRICTHPSSHDHPRIACVVGKSVHRGAVRRHRYQRWLREIARTFLSEHPAIAPYDMVWIAQPGLASIGSLAEAKQAVGPHLEKIAALIES